MRTREDLFDDPWYAREEAAISELARAEARASGPEGTHTYKISYATSRPAVRGEWRPSKTALEIRGDDECGEYSLVGRERNTGALLRLRVQLFALGMWEPA